MRSHPVQLLFGLLLAIAPSNYLSAQASSTLDQLPDSLYRLVVIQPTGEEVEGLVEMVELPDTSALYQATLELVDNSFARQIVDLYFYLQLYLKNQGERQTIEPAYLALTQNQGGYARFGFYLKGSGAKPQSPYVDILENNIYAPQDKLMSFTQLYPHEMGHVFYRLLSSDSSREETSRATDMHYFSVMTDYGTAFNEGFAEHIENAARLFEPNDSLKTGIFADIKKIQSKKQGWVQGFEHDFSWPLRMGYYKATMVLWYQRLEDLKRYEQAMDGAVRFRNATIKAKKPEDRLSFRNSGVAYTSELRNRPQAMATEGVVSSFFTHLLESELPGHYLNPTFYKNFLWDTTGQMLPAEQWLSPVQNQFLKYFSIMHEYVTLEFSESAQWIDFMEGYKQSFPEEWPTMERFFQVATGEPYHAYLPPQLWLMVKGHNHRLLALDAFGAITMPVYTFGLNRAEMDDLSTIDGLSEEDARLLLDWRKEKGFFQSLKAAAEVPGLSEGGQKALLSSNFNQEYFDALPEPELNITALLTTPVKRLLLNAIPYWLVLMIFATFLFREKTVASVLAWRGARYTGLWLLFVFIGLAGLVLDGNLLMSLAALSLLSLFVAILAYRKKKPALWRTLVMLALMTVFIAYNLL